MDLAKKMRDAFAMLASGASIGKVAKRYNISESAVRRVLKGTHYLTRDQGTPREPFTVPVVSKEAKYIAMGMRRDGRSVAEIVEKTGLSKSTVYRLR